MWWTWPTGPFHPFERYANCQGHFTNNNHISFLSLFYTSFFKGGVRRVAKHPNTQTFWEPQRGFLRGFPNRLFSKKIWLNHTQPS